MSDITLGFEEDRDVYAEENVFFQTCAFSRGKKMDKIIEDLTKDEIFLLDRIFVSHSIPIQVCSTKGAVIFKNGTIGQTENIFEKDEVLLTTLIHKCEEHDFPMIFQDENEVFYGITKIAQDIWCVVGPVVMQGLKGLALTDFKARHFISDKNFNITISSIGILCSALILTTYFFTKQKFTEKDIVFVNNFDFIKLEVRDDEVMRYQMILSDEERNRLNYAYEALWMEGISNGITVEQMDMKTTVNAMEMIGRFADKSFKQLEYTAVCTITLATRAAIQGGVTPAEAYAISDLYLQRLSRCQHQIDVIKLMSIAVNDFVMRVKNKNETKSAYNYIGRCKELIARNMRKDIRVNEIADEIGVNRCYLSKKFSEEEGITIQQYIHQEKVRAITNMLKYSEASIPEITEYMGFNSQSHMGVVFKKITGFTPNEYRKKYKIIDFVSENKNETTK